MLEIMVEKRREEIAAQKGYKIDKDGNIKNREGKTLKGAYSGRDGRKYHFFSIVINGASKNVKAHRLQAFQKFGARMYEEGIVVRHLNNDHLDNSYDNVILGAQADNMKDLANTRRYNVYRPIYEFMETCKEAKLGNCWKKAQETFNVSTHPIHLAMKVCKTGACDGSHFVKVKSI